MAASRTARKARLAREIQSQRDWIREHGNTWHGYVERYGSVNDPEHHGEGGELIYVADCARLDSLEAEYYSL